MVASGPRPGVAAGPRAGAPRRPGSAGPQRVRGELAQVTVDATLDAAARRRRHRGDDVDAARSAPGLEFTDRRSPQTGYPGACSSRRLRLAPRASSCLIRLTAPAQSRRLAGLAANWRSFASLASRPWPEPAVSSASAAGLAASEAGGRPAYRFASFGTVSVRWLSSMWRCPRFKLVTISEASPAPTAGRVSHGDDGLRRLHRRRIPASPAAEQLTRAIKDSHDARVPVSGWL